ncbi:MAG: HDOD domain-containing protein [Caldimicrobium sp.]
MSELILEKIFEKINLVPTFPKTAQRALELLRKDEVNYRELEDVVKKDPGIAANFLKLVNSAAFSLHQKVDSLLKAFMVLGVNQIKLLLISSVTGQFFDKNLTGYGVSSEDIWIHSIATGITAEAISQVIKFPPEKQEALYMAALLHDLGKIVLDLYLKLEEKNLFKKENKYEDEDFLQIEWFVLGVDHGMVGGYLLKKWDFSEEISFAVRAHHDNSLMIQNKTAAIVGLSNIIVNLLGYIGGWDAFYYKIPSNLLDIIGITSTDLNILLPEIFKKILLLERTLK